MEKVKRKKNMKARILMAVSAALLLAISLSAVFTQGANIAKAAEHYWDNEFDQYISKTSMDYMLTLREQDGEPYITFPKLQASYTYSGTAAPLIGVYFYVIKPDGLEIGAGLPAAVLTDAKAGLVEVKARDYFALDQNGEYSFGACVEYLWQDYIGFHSSANGVRWYYSAAVELPPDPVLEHHTFVGWYMNEALTIPYTTQKITEDTQLYAKFKINQYKITYVTNSPLVSKDAIILDALTQVTPELVGALTQTGYDFIGWYTDEGLTQPLESTEIAGNMTLYAKWEPVILTVTFYVGGVEYATLNVPYGSTLASAVSSLDIDAYSVKSVKFDGETSKQSGSDFIIMSNAVVDMSKDTFLKQSVSWLKTWWWTLVIGAGVLVLIIIIGAKTKKAA